MWRFRPRPLEKTSETPLPAAPPSGGEAAALLHRLEWTVVRRLDGMLQGDYRTLSHGIGLDFADLREYQPHDDVRHIDWNITARLNVPHVRQFHEDREISAWFLLDLSPSVDFGSRDLRKKNLLAEFVAVLARLLTRHGNRVGAILYGGGVDTVIPPGTSTRHVLRLLHRLLTRPPLRHPGTTDLNELLASAGHLLRSRSTVFVVSDFISRPGWEKPLARLAQRHETLAVRIYDPLEQALPALGVITLHDAETGERLTVDTSNRSFRQRFALLAQEREHQIRTALNTAGVDTLELATDGDLLDATLRFIDMRRRRQRSATAPLSSHLHPSGVPA